MQRVIRRISTTVYALGVLGALTFGASQAFGRAVQSTCRYQPPTWLGACVEPGWNTECTQRCWAYDPNATGTCETGAWYGCCVCIY